MTASVDGAETDFATLNLAEDLPVRVARASSASVRASVSGPRSFLKNLLLQILTSQSLLGGLRNRKGHPTGECNLVKRESRSSRRQRCLVPQDDRDSEQEALVVETMDGVEDREDSQEDGQDEGEVDGLKGDQADGEGNHQEDDLEDAKGSDRTENSP